MAITKSQHKVVSINTPASTGGGGGGGVYNLSFPTNTQFGNIAPGTDLSGLTWQQIIQMATVAYINPSFTSFSITGQAQTVEIGTTVSGNKTFTWGINVGSGIVTLLDIYDNTSGSTLLANTANDGSQIINLGATNFTAQGQTKSFKGIGHNSQNSTDFNSSNFVITGSYLEFYGPISVAANNSATVRALPLNRFVTSGTSFSFATGTVEKIFQIALPATKTLTSVFDATSGFFIPVGAGAGNWNLSTFNVLDAAGVNVSYNVYTLSNAVVYASSHTFNIITS